MKKLIIVTTIILVFCVSTLGCTTSVETFISTESTSSTTPSATATVTATATTAKTITPLPSPTATPSPLPPTPTDTSTLTPQPTLSAEERLEYSQELFRTNGDCSLPCWWGIKPGETTWSETEDFLKYLGARTGSNIKNDGSDFHGTGGFDYDLEEGIIANRIGFLEMDGQIELIYIYSEGYSNPVAFQEQWETYSPDRLLEEYGIPTRVWLESKSSGPVVEGRIAGYTLWIFYDQLGFLILYNGYGEYEPIYHFCPRFDNGEDIRSLEMYLQSPDNPNPIEETAGIIGLEIDPHPNVQSIEDATGLSTIDFYNLFIQEDKQACFDTSRDIWP